MWGTVKELTNSSKQVPPRSLSVDGQMVTSLKKYVIWLIIFTLKKYWTREKISKSLIILTR